MAKGRSKITSNSSRSTPISATISGSRAFASGNGVPFHPSTNGRTPTSNSPPSPSANGDASDPFERQLRMDQELLANVQTSRFRFFEELLDPRRNVNRECGFPDYLTPIQLQQLFDRNPFAQRVCEVMPQEACQVTPRVYDSDDPETPTAFDRGWKTVGRQLSPTRSWHRDDTGGAVWNLLREALTQAEIGHYGVILLGVNDGKMMHEPVDGVEERGSMPGLVDPAKTKDAPDEDVDPTDPDRPLKNDYDPLRDWRDIYGDTVPVPVANGRPQLPPPRPYAMRVVPRSQRQVFTVNFSTGERVSKPQGDKRRLTFARAFSEAQAPVTRWETNRASPRFGMPVSYLISVDGGWTNSGTWGSLAGQPTSTIDVHWTRVVHIRNSGHGGSPVGGQPAMEPVLNCLMNLDKIFGASGEGYWKSCFTGIALTTHPQLGGNVKVNRADLKDQMENYENSLTRILYLMGMQASTIAPSVTDPTPHIEANKTAICVKLAMPKRIFEGSERGELASSEDQSDWADEVRGWWNRHGVPNGLVPLVDRLIMVGALPEPEGAAEKAERLKAQTDPEATMDPDADPEATGGEFDDEADAGGLAAARPTPPSPFGRRRPGFASNAFGLPKKAKGFGFGQESQDAEHDLDPNDPEASLTPQEDDALGSELDPRDEGQGLGAGEDHEAGYRVEIPDVDSQSDAEKANYANVMTTALAAAIAGGVVPEFFSKRAFLVDVCKFPADKVEDWMDEAEEEQAVADAEQKALMAEQGFIPDAEAEGMIDPEQRDMEHEVEMAKAENPAGAGGGFGGGGGFPPGGGTPKPKPGFGKPKPPSFGGK